MAETDMELGMEAVLQLARQCGHQQRLLKMNSVRQEELLNELEVMLAAVNDRVTALPRQIVTEEACNDSTSGSAVAKFRRGNSAVQSIVSSKADLSSEREAMVSAKKALHGMSGQVYDTIYTPALYTRQSAQKAKNPILRGFLTTVGDVLFKFETLKEPPREGCLAGLVFSRWFQMLSVTVILVNSVSIALSADYEIKHLGQEATLVQQNMELALTLFYVVELILKLMVNRLYFFVNEDSLWNCFDFVLVMFSIVEYAVKIHLEVTETDAGGGGMNVGFLRMFRLCKIAKVLRVFRTLRFFTELRLMMDCVLGSFINVFWCLAMIVFVLYVFSLLIVQGLTEYLLTEVDNLSEVYKDQYIRFFGSVSNAVVTLFQATTAGIDWNEAFVVLRVAGVFPSFCFLTYVIIFTISVWNIVTSTFVEKAMKLAQPDLESMIHEKNIKDAKDAGDLARLFLPFTSKNDEGDDVISFEQIRAAAEQPRFRQDLTVRGVDIKNVEIFFKMLSAVNEGGVKLQTLVSACVRMKGVATSIDLQSVSFEIQMISSVMEKKFKEQDSYLFSIQQLLLERMPDVELPSQGWNVDEPLPPLLAVEPVEPKVLSVEISGEGPGRQAQALQI